MGLKLQQMNDGDDWDALWRTFHDAFADPGCPLWALFGGDWQPHDPAAHEAAMRESCDRLQQWHKADPTSTWLKVVDEATGEPVAGARWSIYPEGKPYDNFGPMPAYWWPEGTPRRIATKLLNDFLSTAAKNANHPHAFLNIMFTGPKHRRKGAASLLMDWGFEQAKKHSLPVYIEATKEGKPLYEKYGCKAIQESSLEFTEADFLPTDDPQVRDAVIKQLTPFTWWSMVGNAQK